MVESGERFYVTRCVSKKETVGHQPFLLSLSHPGREMSDFAHHDRVSPMTMLHHDHVSAVMMLHGLLCFFTWNEAKHLREGIRLTGEEGMVRKYHGVVFSQKEFKSCHSQSDGNKRRPMC